MNSHSLNAGFLNAKELEAVGVFNAAERNILIHSTAVVVNFDNITFGENIRIDPFVTISCKNLVLGNYIHIATGCAFFGRAPINIGDFSGISGQGLIYSSSDDFTGQWITGPTVPAEFTQVEHAQVDIGRHCIVGAHSTILPGAQLGDGAAVGSAALVIGALPSWTISIGSPAKPIKKRERKCLELEAELAKNGRGRNV